MNDKDTVEKIALFCKSIGVDSEGFKFIWGDIIDAIESLEIQDKPLCNNCSNVSGENELQLCDSCLMDNQALGDE